MSSEVWFYGKDHRHKRFAAYTIGTRIAEGFMLHNPGVSMSALAIMAADDIYKKSGLTFK